MSETIIDLGDGRYLKYSYPTGNFRPTEVPADVLWQRVDPEVRRRCVEHVQTILSEDVKRQVREHIDLHGKGFWIHKEPFSHFGWGMAMRNRLRQVALDSELPSYPEWYGPNDHHGNWDDYYVQAIEEAVNR